MKSAEHPAKVETKAKTIGYWVTTGILVFCMTGGLFELVGAKMTTDGIVRLGYPPYIIPALGLGKVLAIVAILWPGVPRLKEWAYAGLFFNMLGAIVSHIALKDPAWSVVVTITIAAITLASWALRPQSRRLGDVLGDSKKIGGGVSIRGGSSVVRSEPAMEQAKLEVQS